MNRLDIESNSLKEYYLIDWSKQGSKPIMDNVRMSEYEAITANRALGLNNTTKRYVKKDEEGSKE